MRGCDYRIVASGVDTLVVNARGDLHGWMPDILNDCQAAAIAWRDAQKGPNRDAFCDTLWEIDGEPLLILPHGGGRGLWKWLLTAPALTLEIGDGAMNGIVARARLSSAFLWRHGSIDAWAMVERVLDEMGTFTYQPSEVHLCADIAGRSFVTLQPDHFIKQGQVVRWHQEDALIIDVPPSEGYLQRREIAGFISRHREPETLSFSLAAPHAVVIYNKPREIRVKSRDKTWFMDIWRRNGWDGEMPVVRVECRYEREVLHEMRFPLTDETGRLQDRTGIESMGNLWDYLDTLWAYSVQKWIRHVIPVKGRPSTRWPSSPWWRVVQSVRFTPGEEEWEPGVRRRQREYHEQRMVSAILGYLESWAAWHGSLPEGYLLEDALMDVVMQAPQHYGKKKTDFSQRVAQKQMKLGQVVPLVIPAGE